GLTIVISYLCSPDFSRASHSHTCRPRALSFRRSRPAAQRPTKAHWKRCPPRGCRSACLQYLGRSPDRARIKSETSRTSKFDDGLGASCRCRRNYHRGGGTKINFQVKFVA